MKPKTTLFTKENQKELEQLAQEFIKSKELPLYDQGGQLVLAITELKKGKEFDLMKTLKHESERTHTKGYTIRDEDKLVGYATIREKIDLKKYSLEPIPAEIRIAFALPEYKKEVKKELEEFLQSKGL